MIDVSMNQDRMIVPKVFDAVILNGVKDLA